MKDKKKAAAGAGAGLAVLGVALAVGLGAKKVIAPEDEAFTLEGQLKERAKEIKVAAEAQIEAGEKTSAQIADEIEATRRELLNEAVTRTYNLQLSTIHPGMTMEQVDEIVRAIYAETGADELLAENAALALAEACREYEERMGIPADQETSTGVSAREGGYEAWYTEHFISVNSGGGYGKEEEEEEEKPKTIVEKQQAEEERTGYTEVERHKLVNDYRLANPGTSGLEAYKLLFR
ncbi:hypothetical protein ES703_15034 [subsurface metagenome]